ncbi:MULTISPECIES: squalene synthase HpnC [Gulbenkiania]|uniref:Squalene synthase HpnC n=1 Tax=Gulbenkiania indica TaxID=375574 RepID=A0A0K6GUE9_9NEIS|nr:MULTISPECIES: squalene synthase HpnC [Gulbenkiania]CUA82361.1 squalene synthase HpnC [Gulbenkiania indica]
MSVGHYENFPVGSVLLPRAIRRAVHAIYRFARTADDLADEGDLAPQARLDALAALEAELDILRVGGTPASAMMRALGEAIAEHGLPYEPFYDLLSAFRQDVLKDRYETFAELVDYCRRSANPIGRLMLHLYGERDSRALALSDGICTALQLINFLQDVQADWQKGRVYLPQEDLVRFRVTERQIAEGDTGGLWTALMLKEIGRARNMLQAGAPLGLRLRGRFGFEVRMIVAGGERILKKLHDSGGDVFRQRPVLTKSDWAYVVWRALRAR